MLAFSLCVSSAFLAPMALGITNPELTSHTANAQADQLLKGLFSNMPQPKHNKKLMDQRAVFADSEKAEAQVAKAHSAEVLNTPDSGFSVTPASHPSADKAMTFPQHVSFAKHYRLKGPNYLSSHEVNTIHLPAPIVRVIQPPQQQAKETAAVVCVSGDQCHKQYLLYDQGNTTFSFGLMNPDFKTAQFTVFLANHHTVSLHFSLADIPGDVVHVSPNVAGPALRDTSPTLGAVSDYDQSLIQETQLTLSSLSSLASQKQETLDEAWVLLRRDTHVHPVFAELTQRDYHIYQNDRHVIRVWQLCNVSRDTLHLEARYLLVGLKSLNQNALLAATLSDSLIAPQRCTHLVTISQPQTEQENG